VSLAICTISAQGAIVCKKGFKLLKLFRNRSATRSKNELLNQADFSQMCAEDLGRKNIIVDLEGDY
jgi:hypothetical protein